VLQLSQLVLFAAVLICCTEVQAGESNHRYKDSEKVVLWVNKVGPYNNPQVRKAGQPHPHLSSQSGCLALTGSFSTLATSSKLLAV
jgi:hypothetical protein